MNGPRQRSVVSPASVPALPKHVRIQYEPVRQAFAVLAPEKVFWPDETSLAILRRCDGRENVGEIAAALAGEYAADPEEVAADVTAFLQEWADRLLVRL